MMRPGESAAGRARIWNDVRESPLRHLIVLGVLAALAVPLDLLAWLVAPVEILATALFWEALLGGGAVLFVLGVWFEGRRQG